MARQLPEQTQHAKCLRGVFRFGEITVKDDAANVFWVDNK
jgi:hypothetical protein